MRPVSSIALIALALAATSAFAQARAPATTPGQVPAKTAKAPRASRPAPAAKQGGPEALPPAKEAARPTCPGCAPCPDADRALAVGLGFAFQPAPEEVRALAVEDLGLLGDPRALDALAALALDPAAAVRSAAIRALRSFEHPRAEEILANVVRHSRTDEALKLQALDALLFQRSATARAFLESVRDDRDGQFGARLQEAARTVVTRWGGSPAVRR